MTCQEATLCLHKPGVHFHLIFWLGVSDERAPARDMGAANPHDLDPELCSPKPQRSEP